MKIYSSRKDDLIAERDAYDAETAKYEEVKDDQDYQYRLARKSFEDGLTTKALSIIGRTSLDLDVDVRRGWHSGYEVSIRAHERSKSDDTTALAWNWSVKLNDEGNTVKESGSWSGLQATTPEQLNDLKESVRILEILNNADWTDILNSVTPSSKDYVDPENVEKIIERRQNRLDYEKLIADEELNEAIESGDWIKLNGRPETSYYRGAKGGNWWAKILKVSDSFVTCIIVNDFPDSERVQDSLKWKSAERIKKSNFAQHVAHPVETYQA